MNTSLRRILCPKLPRTRGEAIAIPEEEARHLTQVLRLGAGDEIEALDGAGGRCKARLERRGKELWLETLEALVCAPETTRRAQVAPIVLELAVLKGDAMEWAIEKCVELGVERIAPVITDHGVVRLDRKGPEAFVERWQKIADQALKQCGRLYRLEVAPPRPLGQLLSEKATRVWTDEGSKDSSPTLHSWLAKESRQQIHLLIGPEGGWSEAERRLLQSLPAVSLGPLVLRAETAALFSAAITADHFRSEARKS